MSRSEIYSNLDKKYIWHPFTQMQGWEQEDFPIIEKAKGNYLYDMKGKKYLDGVSSLWVTVHGHQKKELDAAIQKQLKKVAHTTFLGLSHPLAIELAEKLIQIAPPRLTKVFYSDNGSTAVEIALKMAFQYWQQNPSTRFDYAQRQPLRVRSFEHRAKTKFLSLENAYHGDTVGAVAVGGIDLFHQIYKPLLNLSLKAPVPYGKDEDNNKNKCLQQTEEIMKKHQHEIAAFIVEPLVQGAAGMLMMPLGYLKAIRKLCDKYNILLICDEVATGFGRTGKMFACEHEKVAPDILCLAKGITGGYLPLAATLTTEAVYKAFKGPFAAKKTFFHGHTYTANPLACAAAIASINLFNQEKVIEKLQPKIKFLQERLEKFKELDFVGDIRQCGMMVGIELVKDKKTKEPFLYEQRIGHRVILEARKKGVLLRPLGDVIVLMPPLSITMVELDQLLKVAYSSIKLLHALQRYADVP